MHFAHAAAVADLCLQSCLAPCPVGTVLDCIRLALERASRGGGVSGGGGGGADAIEAAASGGGGGEEGGGFESRHFASKSLGKKKQRDYSNRDSRLTSSSAATSSASRRRREAAEAEVEAGGGEVGEELLLDVWRYVAAEYAACAAQEQGEQRAASLRLLVEALVGTHPTPPPPLRIFPVRGSSTLRLHSEHGAPLCLGLAPSLLECGAAVTRLADRIVPQFELERLDGVDGVEELLRFLNVREATPEVLEQQVRLCFRFGLAATADPQLWWDSFRYAVSLGHAHGLAGLMPGVAIALPLVDGRVVSSRDVQRQAVSLPCVLGLRHKHTKGIKHTLALPPSAAASWGGRVRWEVAVVQAFGATFPQLDAERAAAFIGPELLEAVAEARRDGDAGGLEALAVLLRIYEMRLGGLLPKLRAALQSSPVAEECLLERLDGGGNNTLDADDTGNPHACAASLASCCSPRYVGALLSFCGLDEGLGMRSSLHDTRDLLEARLGMLRLRAANDHGGAATSPPAVGLEDATVAAAAAAAVAQYCFTIGTPPPPPAWFCPLSKLLMLDPVCLTDDPEEISYSSAALEEWLATKGSINPATGAPLDVPVLRIPNFLMAKQVRTLLEAHPQLQQLTATPRTAPAATVEEEYGSVDGDGDEDDAASSVGGDACDDATWEILSRLLGFEHTFEPSHCARILYLSLGPALLQDDGTHIEHTLSRVRPFVAALARAALLSSRLNFATEVWPLLSYKHHGGVWLGADYVPFERCIWTAGKAAVGEGSLLSEALRKSTTAQPVGVDEVLRAAREDAIKAISAERSLSAETQAVLMRRSFNADGSLSADGSLLLSKSGTLGRVGNGKAVLDVNGGALNRVEHTSDAQGRTVSVHGPGQEEAATTTTGGSDATKVTVKLTKEMMISIFTEQPEVRRIFVENVRSKKYSHSTM